MLVSPTLASEIVPPSALTAAATADDRPLLRDPGELLVVPAPAGVLRDPDLREDLVLGDRRREEVLEEVGGRHGPLAAGPAITSSASSARIGAGRSPAGSAWASAPPSVPRWRTCGSATVWAALASTAACSRDQRAVRDLVVRRHRADHDRVAVVADAPQLVDLAEVDDEGRRRQPQPEHRDQALAAGQHLDLLGVSRPARRARRRATRAPCSRTLPGS